jgi:hypothetical protein
MRHFLVVDTVELEKPGSFLAFQGIVGRIDDAHYPAAEFTLFSGQKQDCIANPHGFVFPRIEEISFLKVQRRQPERIAAIYRKGQPDKLSQLPF